MPKNEKEVLILLLDKRVRYCAGTICIDCLPQLRAVRNEKEAVLQCHEKCLTWLKKRAIEGKLDETS